MVRFDEDSVKGERGNVFDEGNKVHKGSEMNGGYEVLKEIGVAEAKIEEVRQKQELIGKM